MIILVLNHLWRSTVCLGAAWGQTLLFRKNGAAIAGRRAQFVGAVAAAVLVPVLVGVLSAPAAGAQEAGSAGTVTAQQILQRRYEQARPRTAIPFEPASFDKFAGYYLLPDSYQVIHIYRQSDHYFVRTQLALQPALEVYPDSPTEFFAMVVPAQFSFSLASNGRVSALVLHQNGLLFAADRISAQRAKEVQAELQARIKQDKPSPGAEAAARHLIESQEAGHTDYAAMMPNLAALARLQDPLIQRMYQTLGPLQALKFKQVAPSGLDIYDATFAHGLMQVLISPPTPDGRVTSFGIRRPQ